MDDRLGIELTIENPEEWSTGNRKLPHIRGVSWQSVPTDTTTFALRLTTVIEDDQRLPITAPMRIASPTLFPRWRAADGQDSFQFASISVGSLNYVRAGGNGVTPVVLRDDTAAAQTHANQLRSAHEFPQLAGSVMVPFITDYYQIADRVSLISGRNASLQINVGIPQGEAPTYPMGHSVLLVN